MTHCELCDSDGGLLLVKHEQYRVIAVEGGDALSYPGYCRVVWNQHVREMSDLSDDARMLLMNAVFRVESALRLSLNPDKINLASLGNMTPHLHWHVIPRRSNDPTFPNPVWAVKNAPLSATSGLPVVTLGALGTLGIAEKPADWQYAIRAAFNDGAGTPT